MLETTTAMSNELDPEDFLTLSVADLIRHPRFDAHLRDTIMALTERGPEATVAELAELVGMEPDALAASIVGETVFAEFKRICAENRRAH